jgi:hypothetical protein
MIFLSLSMMPQSNAQFQILLVPNGGSAKQLEAAE